MPVCDVIIVSLINRMLRTVGDREYHSVWKLSILA